MIVGADSCLRDDVVKLTGQVGDGSAAVDTRAVLLRHGGVAHDVTAMNFPLNAVNFLNFGYGILVLLEPAVILSIELSRRFLAREAIAHMFYLDGLREAYS